MATDKTPILVQISPRRYQIVTLDGSSGRHQSFRDARPTGDFFARLGGTVQCTGMYEECMRWIEENCPATTLDGKPK